MRHPITRRHLLALAPAAAAVGAGLLAPARGIAAADDTPPRDGPWKAEPLRAELLPSRHREQVARALETYLSVSDDDILHGFRARAGRPAPGKPLGGWCSRDSAVIFGQLVSGLARLGAYLNEPRATEKAVRLFEEWRATAGDDGNAHMDAYGWDKLVCGLVDLKLFAGHDAFDFLGRTVDWAGRTFDRSRPPAGPSDWDGRHPGGTSEWYTLGENLYRAFAASGEPAFRDFADVWNYPAFWDNFADCADPTTVPVVHAYSHVNSLSSAALAYATHGDERLLRIIRNAHDYVINTQCYATGGYGPVERLLPPDGRLGRALEYVPDHAEICCGSWAAFKLTRYLLAFTGEARFGDWMERVFENLIGAALPVTPEGRTHYYADYRMSSAEPRYFWDAWPCCSGTYLQSVAEYHALIYLRDAAGLFVSLYTPSRVAFPIGDATISVTQETTYPESDEVRLRIAAPRPVDFRLALRVPAWCASASARVNDARESTPGEPGSWLSLARTWAEGDVVTLRLPMTPRLLPVDSQHPRRCAIACGPVALAQDARFNRPLHLPPGDELAARLVAEERPLHFRVRDNRPQDLGTGPFRPLSTFGAGIPYRLYHDLDAGYLY